MKRYGGNPARDPQGVIDLRRQVPHAVSRFEAYDLGGAAVQRPDRPLWTAVCTCGWRSAVSEDQKALIALWDIHQRDAR